MDQKKGGVLVVPAQITFNDKDVVSILLNFTDVDDSLLRKIIESKTVDESRSVVGAFAKKVCNESTQMLTKSWIVFSGQFQFVDPVDYKSPMQLLAEVFAEGNVRPCNYCARAKQCLAESKELEQVTSLDKWLEPSNEVCAENIIKYFYNKAKK